MCPLGLQIKVSFLSADFTKLQKLFWYFHTLSAFPFFYFLLTKLIDLQLYHWLLRRAFNAGRIETVIGILFGTRSDDSSAR